MYPKWLQRVFIGENHPAFAGLAWGGLMLSDVCYMTGQLSVSYIHRNYTMEEFVSGNLVFVYCCTAVVFHLYV